MAFTFKKGVHPKDSKELSENSPIERCSEPSSVYISLSQHIGAPAVPIVEAGQTVKKGQLIAQAGQGLSANIFSSVSGTVKGVVTHITLNGKKSSHILIENDFKEDEELLQPLSSVDKESIINRVREAGIVGMGGATFPSAVKLTPKNEIDTLLINGAECEPYITCDYRIMMELASEFLQGVKYLQTASGAKNVIIGVEENKMPAILHLNSFDDVEVLGVFGLAKKPNATIKVMRLKTKYPQGAEKQLIKVCTKRVVGEGELPASVGVIVFNVHTALSTYYAVKENKPLYERIMTVSGKAVQNPKNLWVKNGTMFKDIAKFCGADENSSAKIISGGPMMGFSVFTLKATTTKGSSSLLFLNADETAEYLPSVCIGCGKCVQACPMDLMPTFIDEFTLLGNYKEAKYYGAQSCIECGCCSYVCPAKRPLVQSVKLAKKIIRERKL